MYFQSIFVLLICLMGLTLAQNINEMDYDELVALLGSDYEAEITAPINNINKISNQIRRPVQQQSLAAPDEESRRGQGSLGVSLTKPSISSLLSPQVEVLQLVEAFLQLKGEMASRIHALINDNFDLFRSMYNVLMKKLSTLHSFTLNGITVFRKILQFAVQMLNSWRPPSVAFGFNKY